MHLHMMSAMLFEQWLFNRSSQIQRTRQKTIFLTYEENMAWSDTCCSLLRLWRLIHLGRWKRGRARMVSLLLSSHAGPRPGHCSMPPSCLSPSPTFQSRVEQLTNFSRPWRYGLVAREKLCRFPISGKRVWSLDCLGRCPISPLSSIVRDSSVLRQKRSLLLSPGEVRCHPNLPP